MEYIIKLRMTIKWSILDEIFSFHVCTKLKDIINVNLTLNWVSIYILYLNKIQDEISFYNKRFNLSSEKKKKKDLIF